MTTYQDHVNFLRRSLLNSIAIRNMLAEREARPEIIESANAEVSRQRARLEDALTRQGLRDAVAFYRAAND